MSFKPTWNTLGLNSSSSNATTGTLGNSDGSWGFLNEISCVSAIANWVLPQANVKTFGVIIVMKMDNTAYTVNIAAYTGESIFNNSTGVSLLNQGDYAMFFNDGSTSVKVIGGNYLAWAKMNIITSPIANDFLTVNALGQAIDSGIKIGNDNTNNTILTSAMTQTYVAQQLINAPTLTPVNFATTINDTLSGLAARDSYTPVAGNIALVKNQTTLSDNGFWVVASGAWTRAWFNTGTGTFQAITTQTTYSQLNITNGVVNILNGTANKNVQFQIYILNSAATFGNTNVTTQATTKIPVSSPFDRFVDNSLGNDTNNNGSQSFPFLTITRALTGASFPLTIHVSSSGASYAMPTTLTNANVCFIGSGVNQGSQTSLTGTSITVTANNQNFQGVILNVPLIINSGQGMNFQDLASGSIASALITTGSTFNKYMTLNDVDLSGNLATYNLDFSLGSGTVYLNNVNACRIKFNGNTNIIVFATNCPAMVFDNANLGNVYYSDTDNIVVNAILTSQAQLTALMADTNTATDGYYTTSGFTPTLTGANTCQVYDILYKQSVQGVITSVSVHRPYYQAGFITQIVNTIPQTSIKTSTGWTYASITPSTNSLVQFDANKNISANNFIGGVTVTPSSATPLVMTVASATTQVITGTIAQTFVLPNATTLTVGWSQTYINQSSATVTINMNGGTLLTTVNAGSSTVVLVTNISTTAGTWAVEQGGGGITALTGDVTASGSGSVVTTIQPSVVTNAKLATVPTLTLKGNKTGSIANPSDLIMNDVKTMLADTVANFTTSSTLTQYQQMAVYTLTANGTSTLPSANLCTGLSYKITNSSNSTVGTILSVLAITTISLFVGQSCIVESDGTTWQILSSPPANFPIISVYQNVSQQLSGQQVITFDTKFTDTNGCFNNISNTVTLNGLSVPPYAFCPNVSGNYQINAVCRIGNYSGNEFLIFLVKNGTMNFRNGSQSIANNGIFSSNVSANIYLNGVGDYIQIYANSNNTTTTQTYAIGITAFDATYVGGTTSGTYVPNTPSNVYTPQIYSGSSILPLTNCTIRGTYTIIGKMLFATINFACNGSTTSGTGTYSITLPSGVTINQTVNSSPSGTYGSADGTPIGNGNVYTNPAGGCQATAKVASANTINVMVASSGGRGFWSATLFTIGSGVSCDLMISVSIN